jgi:hypothetical protein
VGLQQADPGEACSKEKSRPEKIENDTRSVCLALYRNTLNLFV